MHGMKNWEDRLHRDGIKTIKDAGMEAGLPAALDSLYDQQRGSWPMLDKAAAVIENIRTRTLYPDGRAVHLQYNPARIVNVIAPTSPEEVSGRPCPICPRNMPEQQRALPFPDQWLVVCNPLPLFKQHLVLIHRDHVPQSAGNILPAMIEFTRLTGFVTFYNGPSCGASIPDHLHMQASPPGWLPLEEQIPDMGGRNFVVEKSLPCRIFLSADTVQQAGELFERALGALEPLKTEKSDSEPGMNVAVLGGAGGKRPVVAIHPRRKHRPECYYAEGRDKCLVSPGCADMAGLVIVPRLEDFERMDDTMLKDIFAEVCPTPEEMVQVEQKLDG